MNREEKSHAVDILAAQMNRKKNNTVSFQSINKESMILRPDY